MGLIKYTKEKEQKRKALGAQLNQWFFKAKEIKLTCAGCQETILLAHAYRCYYCGFVFCRVCANKHFGSSMTDERLDHAIRSKNDGLIYGNSPVYRLLHEKDKIQTKDLRMDSLLDLEPIYFNLIGKKYNKKEHGIIVREIERIEK